jgi:hypothetical protein
MINGQVLDKINDLIELSKTNVETVKRYISGVAALNNKVNVLTTLTNGWKTIFDQTGILAGEYMSATQTADALATITATADNLKLAIQEGSFSVGVATGSSDAIIGTLPVNLNSVASGCTTLIIQAIAANLTSIPTFQLPETTPEVILKGAGQALVPGDIFGAGFQMILQHRNGNWILLNPASGVSPPNPVAEIIQYLGTVAPDGFLALPTTAATSLLIADYPLLFAKIGNAYGGDGITNFKLPVATPGLSLVQILTGGTIGTPTDGAVMAHEHSYQLAGGLQPQSGGTTNCLTTLTPATPTTDGPTSTQNLAAGLQVTFCIRYK